MSEHIVKRILLEATMDSLWLLGPLALRSDRHVPTLTIGYSDPACKVYAFLYFRNKLHPRVYSVREAETGETNMNA